MSPLIVTAKKLSVLSKFIIKSEAFGFLSFSKPAKSFGFTGVLLSGSTIKNYACLELKNCRPSSTLAKDFDKVIELDVEFDEVKLDDKDTKHGKRQRKRNQSMNAKVGTLGKSFRKKNLHLEEIHLQEKEEKTSSKINNDLLLNCNLLRAKMTELKVRKNREKKKEIFLEGKRLIHGAVSAGLTPLSIFSSRRSDVEKLNLPEDVKVFLVPYRNIELWSDVVTSQGIIGIFKMPDLSTSECASDSLPVTIICDNIRDPGNLGSVLRVVAAAKCRKLILTKGCVDIWDPKVLRAGAGAHFCLPIVNDLLWSDIENEISLDSRVVLADMNYQLTQNEDQISSFKTQSKISSSLPLQCYHSVEYSALENTVFVIGGETHGLSEDAHQFAVKRNSTRAFIPLSNGIESLNNSVALGIFIYEFKRQLDCLVSSESLSSVPESDSFESKT